MVLSHHQLQLNFHHSPKLLLLLLTGCSKWPFWVSSVVALIDVCVQLEIHLLTLHTHIHIQITRTHTRTHIHTGDSGVGKTSLILRLCEGRFNASCASTLGLDFSTKMLTVGEERVVFQLWDTAGQERSAM